MHRVNPYEYFKDVLERLPRMTNQDKVDRLTPLDWKKSREQARRKAPEAYWRGKTQLIDFSICTFMSR